MFYIQRATVIRKFFEFLSIFDWVTPVIAVLEGIPEGGPLSLNAWTFFIPYDEAISQGWSAVHIENLLKQHGVKTWGSLVHLGEFFFRVRLEQARWAEYVLVRYGVPVHPRSRGAPYPKNKAKRISRPKHQQPSRDVLSFLDDFCHKYLPPPLP